MAMTPLFPHDVYGVSEQFITLMKNRMKVSHFKYGNLADNVPWKVNVIKSLEVRLNLYVQSGNVEWLVDVANLAMIAAMYPDHPNAHFDPNTVSPGFVEDMK